MRKVSKRGSCVCTDLPLYMIPNGNDGVLSELHKASNLTGHDIDSPLGDHPHPLLLLNTSVHIRTCVEIYRRR